LLSDFCHGVSNPWSSRPTRIIEKPRQIWPAFFLCKDAEVPRRRGGRYTFERFQHNRGCSVYWRWGMCECNGLFFRGRSIKRSSHPDSLTENRLRRMGRLTRHHFWPRNPKRQ
jgi:hypothetical protein